MKRHQALLGIGVCFVLILGLRMVPTMMAADSSPIVGNWEGTLDPGARPKKRIVVHITAAPDGSLSGTVDYPDESASGALITAINYNAPVLHFENTSGQVSYDGTSVIALDQNFPMGIALDQTNVYWTNNAGPTAPTGASATGSVARASK